MRDAMDFFFKSIFIHIWDAENGAELLSGGPTLYFCDSRDSILERNKTVLTGQKSQERSSQL